MPAQFTRLIILFLAFIGAFLLIRYFLIPESFGQYGHYRGDSLIENASYEIVFADIEDCFACHSDIQEKLDNDVHADLSCLTCHGPGLEHVNDPQAGNIQKESGRKFCGRCHDFNPAKSFDVVYQVDIKTHHPEAENCIDCHNPHEVWEGLE